MSEVVVGVAVAIPQPHATVLTNWRRHVGDPAADLVFPHVTLLPPTPVPADAMDDVEAHLAVAAKEVEPFSMHLAGTGTFRPLSPVVFIQVATGVSQCETLEGAIRTGPLERELAFPYHPHVTVAHDIPDAGLDDAYDGLSTFVARFAVGSFVLFSREDGGRWTWRTEFPLGGTEGDAAG
ncbi:2'-5' RNA ligase [Jatrophihabitans endophyticus]|uniref:2'-5' RNA ligase n=1 Tax=Jatrophihabitans endophyticus TaxID=1206085 RepID=A0A1M5GBF4_9ACTN|nr:2'-5' RNA ligase family protein [Jatrophihabitans endophyticus]SHG01085.1 2'-5' RNA ligase [Jatrophihabitans endophyticus]